MLKFLWHTEEKIIKTTRYKKFTFTIKFFNIRIFTHTFSTSKSFL